MLESSAAVGMSFMEDWNVMQLRTWLHPRVATARSVLERHGLQMQVGETRSRSGVLVLRVGPQEWWALTPRNMSGESAAYANAELAAQGVERVDLTAGLATIRVVGPVARTVLSKGCGLDLHPGAFGVGRCARTRLAKIAAVLLCREESCIEIFTGRSYAAYLHSWLLDAAAEFTEHAPITGPGSDGAARATASSIG